MGIRIGIGSLKIGQGSTGVDWSSYWATQIGNFKSLVDSKVAANRISEANSTFNAAGQWVTALGSLAADVTTYPGYLYLNFSGAAANQAVKLPLAVETGADHGYLVSIRCKVQSGTGTILQIGSFQNVSANTSYGFDITPNSEYRWYYNYCHSFASTDFYIGIIAANNNGTDIIVDEIKIQELAIADWYDLDISSQTNYYTYGAFSALKKSENDLLNVCIMGDSILANPLTGTTPAAADDEGDTMRPIRLITNNIARRYYDDRKYNVPAYRRLDHAAWVRSTLSGGDDFTETNDVNNGTITAGEKYFRSVERNAYCEVTIPNGMTNCAIIYATYYQDGGVDYDDAIAVTINGGDISAYGDATLNSQTLENNAFARSGQKIVKYTGLPAGENVIRLTKSDSTKIFDIWGAMYWNGNTMRLNNLSTGGMHSTYMLSRLQYYAKYNSDFTNWLIEIPEINNSASAFNAATSAKKLLDMININGINLANTIFITPHPFGTDPSDGDPNYYTTYDTPIDYKQRCTLDICVLVWLQLYFIDLFRYFETDIIARGGTLVGGEAGGYYTTDGQHLSSTGTGIFEGFLMDKIPEIPE